MFPFLAIAIGIAVLLLGKRLAVLGAAVGALVGLGLLKLFPSIDGALIQLAIVGGLAILGAIGGGFAKGIVSIIILVLGALAGAAVVLGVFDLLNVDGGLLKWLLVIAGAVAGFVLISRARRGSRDWGIIILTSLVGAMLIARGIGILMPNLGGAVDSLIFIVLAGAGIVLQAGVAGKPKAAPQV